MIKFRNVATAFLMNDNDFLLMERNDHNERMPSFWYGVGGHLEQEELNDPRAACLREIKEETGIDETQIINLKLKYIVMRRSYDETVINYIYFGESTIRDVVENDEGSLHWVNRDSVLKHFFIDALRLTLAHYFEIGESINEILVGVVKTDDNNSAINWSVLQDMKNAL